MKATYIGKWYHKEHVFLQYEYRGHKYEVVENRAKGNEPLSWQHKNEQARIDRLIEMEKQPSGGKPIDIDEIWKLLGWEE